VSIGESKGQIHSIPFGKKTIRYSFIPVNRTTMEIAVLPDGAVTVKAPHDTGFAKIEERLKKRARWILKQQRFFRQFPPASPKKYFVSGETHLYLGKKYRMKLLAATAGGIKLTNGYFIVNCREKINPENVKKLLYKWYLEKAREQFNLSLYRCLGRFKHSIPEKPRMVIKRMDKRWGSLSENGMLTINTELVKAPKECIDYVFTHELCHLKYHDHSTEFYKLLNSILPGWEKIKNKLEHCLI
jgi:predicted metal-dependent hydrolase